MHYNEIVKPGRYIAIPFWLRLIPANLLRPSAKLVWATIANHLGKNAEAFPSLKLIALEAGLSVQVVQRDIKMLETFRLLSKRRTRTANHYTLSAPRELLEYEEQYFESLAHRRAGDEDRTLAGDENRTPVEDQARVTGAGHPRVTGTVHSWLTRIGHPELTRLVHSRVTRTGNLRVSGARQGTTKKEKLQKERPQEELPHKKDSRRTTSLSPASQERKREKAHPSTPSGKEIASLPANNQAAILAGKKAITRGKATDQDSRKRRFAQLATIWKRKVGNPGDVRELKAFLQRMTLQEKDLDILLDPERVVATVEKFDLEIEFKDLWKKSGRSCVWYKLHRGRRPDISRRTKFRDEEIEAIYQAYPRHIKKGEAEKEIQAALNLLKKNRPDLPLEEHVVFLLDRTKAFAKSDAGKKGRFTPYPANWFRNAQYLDDEQEWNTNQNRSGNIERVIDEERDEEPGDSVEALLEMDISL